MGCCMQPCNGAGSSAGGGAGGAGGAQPSAGRAARGVQAQGACRACVEGRGGEELLQWRVQQSACAVHRVLSSCHTWCMHHPRHHIHPLCQKDACRGADAQMRSDFAPFPLPPPPPPPIHFPAPPPSCVGQGAGIPQPVAHAAGSQALHERSRQRGQRPCRQQRAQPDGLVCKRLFLQELLTRHAFTSLPISRPVQTCAFQC